ncbi:Hypothetical predicted protein [Octopus vulgaris]|uniref:Uncharacterized protein n=1 Tax=Octopus vulgaris TaxID=6645 RepID=A0AA36ATN8_OCTVU|nr:Hypothetical predicted protein [Octopus vulgaris]
MGGDCPASEKENQGDQEELCVAEPVVVVEPVVVAGPKVLAGAVVVAKSEETAESEVAEPKVAVAVPCLNPLTSGPLSPGTQDDCVVPIGEKPQVWMDCRLNVRSGKPSVQKAVKRTKPGSEARALRMMVGPPRSRRLLQCRVSFVFDGCLGLEEPDWQCTLKARVRVGRTLVEAGADSAGWVSQFLGSDTSDL